MFLSGLYINIFSGCCGFFLFLINAIAENQGIGLSFHCQYFCFQMGILREGKRRGCSWLQGRIVLVQSATMTKQSLSLTTSHLIMGSGNQLTLFVLCKSWSLYRYVLMAIYVHQWFQTDMGRGAKAQSGDLWCPWAFPEGPRIQRWIYQKRTRCCSSLTQRNATGWLYRSVSYKGSRVKPPWMISYPVSYSEWKVLDPL